MVGFIRKSKELNSEQISRAWQATQSSGSEQRQIVATSRAVIVVGSSCDLVARLKLNPWG
jgi:hypothetical protein